MKGKTVELVRVCSIIERNVTNERKIRSGLICIFQRLFTVKSLIVVCVKEIIMEIKIPDRVTSSSVIELETHF